MEPRWHRFFTCDAISYPSPVHDDSMELEEKAVALPLRLTFEECIFSGCGEDLQISLGSISRWPSRLRCLWVPPKTALDCNSHH